MPRTFLLSVLLTGIALPALAADFPATSRVSAAVVYPQGAQVTRELPISLPAGDHQVIVTDLPLDFDFDSLRVTGAADGALTIRSVDHRIDRLPPMDDPDDPVRQRIEAEIEALEQDLRDNEHAVRLLQADTRVAQLRLDFVENLIAAEPDRMKANAEQDRAGPELWPQMFAALAAEADTALTARVTTEREIAALDRAGDEIREALEKKRQELVALTMPPPESSIATVALSAGADLSGTLTLTYRVQDAGWSPVYDLRLAQGDTPSLTVERHARIRQATGEAWRQVDLTLSTARPSGRVAAPELDPLIARLWSKDAELRARSGLTAPDMMKTEEEAGRPSAAQSGLPELADQAPEPLMATPEYAQIETQGRTVQYRLPSPADVAGDGTVRQLAIDSGRFDVRLLARATPEFDSNAYLYAAVDNGFSGPILPGRASLYRDGAFVGRTQMRFLAQDEEATLPFGAVDGLTVERRVRSREEGDVGVLTTSSRRTERFELVAESARPHPVTMTVYDRVPTSEDTELDVRVTSRPEPTETDVDGKRGVLAWTFELPAGGEKRIEFGYDLDWPRDQNLVLDHFPGPIPY